MKLEAQPTSWMGGLVAWMVLTAIPPNASAAEPANLKAAGAKLFAQDNLMAWCIVPFDAKKRGPEERAEMLAKLGIPAGRVQQLYRERQPLPPDSKEKRPPCPQCADIGYFGRTAVFELLEMNDKLREALIKLPQADAAKQLDYLKKIAKTTGHRGLQEEGIVLLALGITSLSELQRVLKQ